MQGTSLSHFKIKAKLGEGGMGEVWRADDTKLGREVALKVLPEAFAEDADRMGRFAREAQVLASLNHTNIAAIYGLEEGPAAGRVVRALVMELVEGETLGERIARGPIPLDETLKTALQIAEALEAAHEKGIVHRDLKPANVKITPEGKVKVLDFGLAKAVEEERPEAELAHSPTLTAAATQAGIILGTAAYMSPEQAAASPTDRRADIWSFGVVLAEMLTGKQQFQGHTVSHVLASVLKDQPEWGEFPADIPPRILELTQRCLRKDPLRRLQAIGEARILLQEYLADPSAFEPVAEPAAETVIVAPPAPAKRLLPWAVAAVLALALIGAFWALWPETPAAQQPARLSLELPSDAVLFRGYGSSVEQSPDGLRVAYVFGGGNLNQLFLQSYDRWDGDLLVEGTGDGRPYHPFFSPDGRWVGFVTPKQLKKVPANGGTPIKLCDVAFSRGATWGPDGDIVFAPNPRSGLSRVPAVGGEPAPLTELDEENGEASHRWPQFLPGGKAVLFTSLHEGESFEDARIEVLSLDSGERRTLHRGGYYARYVPSGHLVYVNSETIFSIPFDVEALETTGSAAPILEGLATSPGEGGAHYSVSEDGKLAYLEGGGGGGGHAAFWMDREGNATPFWQEQQVYRNPRVSPDGTRLVVDIEAEGQRDIWVYDIARDVPTRLTFDDATDSGAVWSPDGKFIYFASDRDGAGDIYRKASDGTGEAERLTDDEAIQYPWSISADGKWLAGGREDSETSWDLWLTPLDEGGESRPFLATSFLELGPMISPDGRWIAYFANDSGNFEIYARPISGRGKWQISSEGASWPFWSPDGTQLFFWSDATTLSVVDVAVEGDTLRVGRPRRQLEDRFVATGGMSFPAHITPDGERFVVFLQDVNESESNHEHLRVVVNWTDELRTTFAGQ